MEIKKQNFEIFIGTMVLIVSIVFSMQIYKSGSIRSIEDDGIILTASFGNVDGIEIGTDVKISGIKIGSVIEKAIDHNTYKAILTFNIRKNIKLTIDASAAVVSSGLLGSKYIDIKNGFEDSYLQNNGKIISTQSSLNLEELIAKFAFNNDK